MSKNIKINGLEVTIGNTKLGNDTMIFNMGSATECPSRANGTCKLGNKCYALKAERMYPQCKPYRDRQQAYWLNNTAQTILNDLTALFEAKRVRVNGKLVPLHKTLKWFRFNEAGDFHSQACIDKLNTIAFYLKKLYAIETYGYSARSDLDFSQALFNCKGSGHDHGNNGKTIARKMPKDFGWMDYNDTTTGELFKVCPMDCKICNMCKTDAGINIVFPLH